MTTINIPTHIKGDTFNGYIFNVTDDNGEPVNLTGSSIKMQQAELHLKVQIYNNNYTI